LGTEDRSFADLGKMAIGLDNKKTTVTRDLRRLCHELTYPCPRVMESSTQTIYSQNLLRIKNPGTKNSVPGIDRVIEVKIMKFPQQ
jgi:hypothetical protein